MMSLSCQLVITQLPYDVTQLSVSHYSYLMMSLSCQSLQLPYDVTQLSGSHYSYQMLSLRYQLAVTQFSYFTQMSVSLYTVT